VVYLGFCEGEGASARFEVPKSVPSHRGRCVPGAVPLPRIIL